MDNVVDTKARWERLEALFHRASELPSSEREAMARLWCGDDADLLNSLLQMIASDSEVEDLLASPPELAAEGLERPEDDLAVEEDDSGIHPNELSDVWIGQLLGPFQIDRMLGRGGMGVVYLAHRVRGGFEQRVAIKLIARHLRSSPAVHQFNLERNALAALDHKNIARLIDAGVTPEGSPFVAMEYIEGRRLDVVCDDPSCSTEYKLHLMLQLCEAVSYVNRNLILHRDLKPGNVMVTQDDVVKLLDFGTVKLLGTTADLSSEMTQAGMRPMTLRYSSPEHIEGKRLSTSADIYSLGMILYRLLAGQLPDIAFGLSVGEYVGSLRGVAITPPSALHPAHKESMDRDLDAIVMKAIRVEPEMRYGSAEALAADLSRCLEQRPVLVRRGSWRYRGGKLFRRHRWRILAGAAILIVIAVGLVLTVREARIARKEQQRADLGIEQERGLAHFLFRDYFERLKDIPGSTAAQRSAVVEALSYLDRLSKIADNPSLRLETMEAYRRMALLQGDPYEQNLGDPQGALKSLNKARALADSVSASSKGSLEMLSARALLERTFSEIYYGVGDTQQAVEAMRRSVALYDQIVQNPSAKVNHFQLASNAYNGLADELGQPNSASLGDTAGALAAYQHDIALSQSALKLDPGSQLSLQSIALARDKIGQLLMSTDPEASIEAFKRSLAERQAPAILARNSFRNKRGIAVNTLDLGDALSAARNYKDAIDAYETARGTLESFASADAKDVRAKHDVAVLLADEASAYIDQLNPVLTVPEAKSQASINRQAAALLQRSRDILEQIANVDDAPRSWRVLLAYDKVRLGTLNSKAGEPPGEKLTAEGLKDLQALAAEQKLSIQELNWITDAELTAEPQRLRNAELALANADRLVALDHGTNPGNLAMQVLALRAHGDQAHASEVAKAALALLAPMRAGERTPRTRKLLEDALAAKH